MKDFFKKIGSSIILGLLFICSSCTNEEIIPYPTNDVYTVQPTKVVAYSGDTFFGNGTRSNEGNGDIGNQVWKQFGADDLENVTDDERDNVLKAIENKTTGKRISEDVVFPWENYFLQDVISAQSGYGGAGNSGNPSASYVFEAWNTGSDCSPYWHHGDDFSDYEEVTNSAHLNNYFQKENSDGTQTRINETTLMTNMKYGTYDEMKGKQFRWYINCHENLHWYEYIVVEVDGNYYICFDFACGYLENDVDGNEGKGNTQNDWDYNDWILKITPAGSHEDVWRGSNSTGKPNTTPQDKVNKSEVEVNLHGMEREDYLESHLSIHVRHAGDVEVFIPIPETYYCDADDLMIVQKHLENLTVHGGPTHVDFDINGNIVSLNVEYLPNGIKIWTEGINEDVIEYLDKTFGDGITFEIWNYFDPDVIDFNTLKEYLNQSTIKFLNGKEPDEYYNSFVTDDDCDVSIVSEQSGSYSEGTIGLHECHSNGSDSNICYEHN